MSDGSSRVSRREFFLRLSRNEAGVQDRILEVSCRTLFMRCHDAASEVSAPVEEYDPAAGEPPAVWARRTADDLLGTLERELHGVHTLRLFEPEWLEGLAAGSRVTGIIDAFRARGGRVELSRR